MRIGEVVIQNKLSIYSLFFILLIQPCSSALGISERTKTNQHIYIAYNRNWYIYDELTTKSRTFYELLTGERSSGTNIKYLEDDKNQKVVIQDCIYSLRKDGTYKKCERFQGNNQNRFDFLVLNYENKLYIYLRSRNSIITDCNVHPPRLFDQIYKDVPQSYLRINTIFWGEFNSTDRRFYIDEYVQDVEESEYNRLHDNPDFYYKFRTKYSNNCK